MKKKLRRVCSFVFAICLLSTMFSANAIMTRSSITLSTYESRVTAGANGKVSLSATVSARSSCSKIGISWAYIYESSDGGNTFSLYDTFHYEDYPSMISSGMNYYKTPINFTGTIGNQYYAKVLCYAANENGSDTKTCITNVVTAKR